MEESAQITAALRYVSWGKEVALITDARFSGLSTGACIGHVGPEALAGGPIGKLTNGDFIEIVIDLNTLEGAINLVGESMDENSVLGVTRGNQLLAERAARDDLAPHPDLPAHTRLWAPLQEVGGGTWSGCVYDVDAIVERLRKR